MYGKPFVSKLSIQKMCYVRLQNRLDSAQNRLDCDRNRLHCNKNWLDCDLIEKNWLDCTQNQLDCDKKLTPFLPRSTPLSTPLTQSKKTQLDANYRLDCVPRSNLNLPCSSKPSTIESILATIEAILQQSSRSFSNWVDPSAIAHANRHLTTPTGHAQ